MQRLSRKSPFAKTAVNNAGKEKAEMANNANFDAHRKFASDVMLGMIWLGLCSMLSRFVELRPELWGIVGGIRTDPSPSEVRFGGLFLQCRKREGVGVLHAGTCRWTQ